MFPVNIIGDPVKTDYDIKIRFMADSADATWRIPQETPVAFVYNRRNYAVMLATPQDVVDFVVGFSLTEEVISAAEDVQALEIAHTTRGIDLRIHISEEQLAKFDLKQRRRTLAGSAGCGICGLENADSLFAPLPVVTKERVVLNGKAMEKAINALGGYQPINKRTRSVHAAAWVRHDGEIVLLREDVGRHNALDKLLGAMALQDMDARNGFVLMSSRCSYELVEKAARRGVRALVAISGPTGLALDKAKQANLALYARGPEGVVELVG